MLIEDVKKLSPKERFWYWIGERFNIYMKRKYGAPKPWTDDAIMQTTFFTNPYRENDKVTVWFRENIREPLRDSPKVIFATICFRWFNYIPTGELLIEHRLLDNWQPHVALDILGSVRDKGGQVFTGAFMINSPAGKPKLEAIIDRVTKVWDQFEYLSLGVWPTMEACHNDLIKFEGLGGFMAYEVVCDLRYTKHLAFATDKLTWCNPGPGAIRGVYRLLGKEIVNKSNSTSPPRLPDWKEQTIKLLEETNRRFAGRLPPMEMREIEHSLCEWDKMERVLWGQGRSKRTFNGRA